MHGTFVRGQFESPAGRMYEKKVGEGNLQALHGAIFHKRGKRSLYLWQS